MNGEASCFCLSLYIGVWYNSLTVYTNIKDIGRLKESCGAERLNNLLREIVIGGSPMRVRDSKRDNADDIMEGF